MHEPCPDTGFYGEAYAKYGMFGEGCPAVMAHCVYSTEEEIQHDENALLLRIKNVMSTLTSESVKYCG